MAAHVYDHATGAPKQKVPYEPSHDDWAELSNHTHDPEPEHINLAWGNVIRDAVLIKSTCNNV